jgi:16S rRNA (cytosine967-C5)-methyltransferase
MTSPRYTARSTAWLVLNRCDITRHDTADLLNDYLPDTDRGAQATDIVFGVIRNRLAIDTVIKRSGNIEPGRVKPSLWNLLRLGTYELVYAPKTAEYAILNEVGNLARQKGNKRTVGFVNAVLRAVQTNILSRQAPLQQGSPRTIMPQNEKTGCSFKIDILPDTEKDPVNYYSTAFSLPTWLISQWLNVYGDSTTRQICQASNRTPSLIAQPNVLYTTPENLAVRLSEEGVESEISPETGMLSIKHAGQITKIRAFLDGLTCAPPPAVKRSPWPY